MVHERESNIIINNYTFLDEIDILELIVELTKSETKKRGHIIQKKVDNINITKRFGKSLIYYNIYYNNLGKKNKNTKKWMRGGNIDKIKHSSNNVWWPYF